MFSGPFGKYNHPNFAFSAAKQAVETPANSIIKKPNALMGLS
jgi:hypothetical protein